MPTPPNYTVTAGRSFISNLPESGLKITNNDTGETWRIQADPAGGLRINKTTDTGQNEGLAVHPALANEIRVK